MLHMYSRLSDYLNLPTQHVVRAITYFTLIELALSNGKSHTSQTSISASFKSDVEIPIKFCCSLTKGV